MVKVLLRGSEIVITDGGYQASLDSDVPRPGKISVNSSKSRK